MKSYRQIFFVAMAVVLASTASKGQCAWGPSRPGHGPVQPVIFEDGFDGGCSQCNGGGGPCDACGNGGANCGCNDCYDGRCCLLPRLVGGVVHHVAGAVHWLFCCDTGPCCSGAWHDGGCDGGCAACGGGTSYGSDGYDLRPAPDVPTTHQANPFKDDSVSVVPRRRPRSASRRNYWGVARRQASTRRPARPRLAVERAAYAQPDRGTAPVGRRPRTRSTRDAAVGRPDDGRRLSRKEKQELLDALRAALE